jgi:hypothetical protein
MKFRSPPTLSELTRTEIPPNEGGGKPVGWTLDRSGAAASAAARPVSRRPLGCQKR